MSWLYEKWSLPSEYNGRINVFRSLGEWDIRVEECGESSGYLQRMWRHALGKIPVQSPISRVLVLGLAGGNTVNLLHARWPSCKITAVEIDPVMVEIFRRVRIVPEKWEPNIIVGDATTAVPALTEEFDLVIVDTFIGPTIPGAVISNDFFHALARRLTKTGFLLVNGYAQPETFVAADSAFARCLQWKHSCNELALFQHSSVAGIGNAPGDYVPFRSCREYLERECSAHKNLRMVTENGAYGTYWRLFPTFEETVIGEREPPSVTDGWIRRMTWLPMRRTDIPPGWTRGSERRRTAFSTVDGTEPIERNWSAHAKRHLKQWKGTDTWEVFTPTIDEFIATHAQTHLSFGWKKFFKDLLRMKTRGHGDRIGLIGVRRRGSPNMEAGFAYIDIPEVRQSMHLVSCILDSARNSPVGVGMIYEWFTGARARGLRFCDFDTVWAPGNTDAWYGFSRFKAQFDVTYVNYPGPLTRWSTARRSGRTLSGIADPRRQK